MYPSKGGNPYGQNYAAQQAYAAQLSAAGYPSVSDASGMAARQAMMAPGQESDYRGTQVPQYGGAYAAVYGSAALTGAQQGGGASSKESGPSGLHGRTGYSSALAEASKFASGAIGSSLAMNNDEYLSASNRAYNQKTDQYSTLKSSDYAREYAEHQAALEDDTARRYADPVALSRQHQASLARQQMLKAQLLSGSDMRQADYTARVAPIHPAAQDLSSYAGRLDADPRSLLALGGTAYGAQHASSILGEAPRRNADNLIYAQGSGPAAAYGVGLPPGRDYGSGKGLRGPSPEPDYQGNLRGVGPSMFDDRKDDRSAFLRDLEAREDERRRELFREREKDRERDERERRERDRVRDRERDRERERERERDRERDRVRERRDRDRERERDRKRAADSRRERTPSRGTRDRQGSSLPRDERPSRRVTPRREIVHRHHSPVKEKKREYLCKVYPFSLVDAQRDFLSLNKRYPRLAISPDFSKVVFNWPKEKLNLSLHTPVSFEHDFIETASKTEDKGSIALLDESTKTVGGTTVWNAKVILMSGISNNALEELSSAKSSDRRIIHLNNILKFAILRKDHSYMAIGGPWDATIDGGDPSVDHGSLIPTARRHLKDITQLDLQNCSNWNPFLEIHYDRVGKDGLFSHKEITVLFLPDLSESLPLLEQWRTQWLAHVKDAAKREKQRASKQKKSNEKEVAAADKSREKGEKDDASAKKVKIEAGIAKDEKVDKTDLETSIEKKVAPKGTDKAGDDTTDTKKSISEQKGKGLLLDDKQVGSGDKPDGKEVSASVPSTQVKKPTVKKIVKKKIVGKKAGVDVKLVEDDQSKQEVAVQEDDSSGNPVNVKTYVKKKITKKGPVGKSSQMETADTHTADVQTEKKLEKEPQVEVNEKATEPAIIPAVQETEVKTTGKKKVIRRIIKRKVSGTVVKDANAVSKKLLEAENTAELPGASKGEDAQLDASEKEKGVAGVNFESVSGKKENTSENNIDVKKDANESQSVDNSAKEKGGSKSSTEPKDAKKEDSKKEARDGNGRLKDDTQKKDKDAKSESKHKPQKEAKEKVIPEEPPRHPGFILQTKQAIDSKERLRSMSLSLDGLLDYNDKDIEESTFELSIFAESLNEMLQYEMGSRILSFLEKLRRRFVSQRKQRKRQREENIEKEKEKDKDSAKRQKKNVDPAAGEEESLKVDTKETSTVKNDEKMDKDVPEAGPAKSNMETSTMKNDDKMDKDVPEAGPAESNMETEAENNDAEEEEEDPEEEPLEEGDPEMDEEMDDAVASEDGENEGESSDKVKTEDVKTDDDKNIKTDDDKNKDKTDEDKNIDKPIEENNDKTATSEEKLKKRDEKPAGPQKAVSVEPVVVNKELLQAFKFFDQNQVGYLKVEDLRCIIHNLGKFLCNRDVKEMVQSALYESSTARDNRIFYKKLTALADV